MERPLGSFETALALTGEHAPFVVVVVLALDGGPSPERLRAALDALQRHHAPLGLRIVRRDGRLWYVAAGTPPIPLDLVPRPDEAAWGRVATAELNRGIEAASGPLLRCAYLAPREGGGAAEVVLTFHHAGLDAVTAAPLLRDLLEQADPAVGAAPRTRPLAGPMEDGFPPAHRGLRGLGRRAVFLARQLGDEAAHRARGRGGRTPPVVEPTRCAILPLGLDERETDALVRSTRRRRVTINGALSAAFLLAVARQLYGGRAASLRYITFANLRPYLVPAAGAEVAGSCIAMLRYSARLRPGEGLWPLARQVSEAIARGGRRGDRFVAAQLSAWMMRATLGQRRARMAATAVSYTGVTPLEPRTRSFRLRDVHAFVSNFGLGPELTAQARLFRGRLAIDAVYLESDLDAAGARRLGDEVLHLLQSAARGE